MFTTLCNPFGLQADDEGDEDGDEEDDSDDDEEEEAPPQKKVRMASLQSAQQHTHGLS